MSPPETSCNEEIAPWKFNKGEGCGGRKGSPERYRHRQPDSYSRRHKSHNDRAHYGNRVWRRDSPYSRHPSSDLSRVQYDRTHISDEKRHHDDDRSKASSSAGGREQTVYTIKRPWKGHRSPGRPRSNRSRWDEPPRTSRSKDSSYSSEKSDDNLHIIFNHINDVCTQSNQTQPERPMSFIDKLIADEAMRMLSQATSLQKTTYLNVPFVPIETTPSASVDSEATEISKPESGEQTTEEKQASVQDAAVVTAADSALLQKSAEQVTKKLINQLTTMSKYDLKQIIDNPGGKYETALNRHAQNKLRAEVRKQLKSIGLNELGSSCVAGDGTVEPDVAIDANKIPPALLAQIGQALDLDLEDLTQTDSESVEHVVVGGNYLATLKDTQSVDGTISPKSGNKYSTAVQSTSNQEEDPQSSNKTLTKVRVAHKPSPTTPGRKKDNNVQNANATVCIEGANSPGAKTPKSKTKTRNRKKKGVNGPGGKQPLFTLNVSHEEINLNATLELSRTSKKGIMNAAPKPKTATEGSNISNTLTVQCKAHDAASTYNNNLNTNSVSLLPVEPTRVAKIVPFLRISTVDELNRRLEDHEGTKSVDPEQATELNRTEHTAVEGSVQSHDNVSNRMETNKFYGFNTFETDPTNTADDCIRLSTVLHPCPTPNISNRESDESIQNRLNNDQRSESASTASVQREQEQPNTPIFQRLIERRKKRSKSAIAKHLEGMLNKKGETHITEDGEIAIGRVNGRTLKRNNDYLAMICPTGRKALPFANAKWIPQKDMNRQRNSPADTTSNAEQCTTEAVANVTDELKNKLPVVPDTHLVKQRKNRSQNRWNRPMPLNSSGVLFNNQTVGKDVSRSSTSERIASLSLPSREDQILNEAYDQYTINTVAEDEPDETEDQQNPAIDGTVQDTSNLTAIANLPSIR
uniref:Uncharacterized protein n=1 Tax=Anopheles christyi TaxID=43041 RepID=A0A182JSD6_9DIPT